MNMLDLFPGARKVLQIFIIVWGVGIPIFLVVAWPPYVGEIFVAWMAITCFILFLSQVLGPRPSC